MMVSCRSARISWEFARARRISLSLDSAAEDLLGICKGKKNIPVLGFLRGGSAAFDACGEFRLGFLHEPERVLVDGFFVLLDFSAGTKAEDQTEYAGQKSCEGSELFHVEIPERLCAEKM